MISGLGLFRGNKEERIYIHPDICKEGEAGKQEPSLLPISETKRIKETISGVGDPRRAPRDN
jgi:hypothetical protein